MLTGTINNYTKDHEFIWEEITIPITYESDWKLAHKKIMKIAKKRTKKTSALARKGLAKLGKRYYLEEKATKPGVYMRLTDNWIELSLRYITDARDRRGIYKTMSREILEEIEKSKKVKIASQTIDIVGFPRRKK